MSSMVEQSINPCLLILFGLFSASACDSGIDIYSSDNNCGGVILDVGEVYLNDRPFSVTEKTYYYSDLYHGSVRFYDYQFAAGYLGFGFHTVDDVDDAIFVYQPHSDFLFNEFDNIVFERRDCAIESEEGRLTLHHLSRVNYDFASGFHECFVYAFFSFARITVSPSQFEYIVVREGDPVPAPGDWEIILTDLDEEGVGIGFNTESPRYRCLMEVSPLNRGRRQYGAGTR